MPKKIEDDAYVIDLDKYANVGTHCNTLYVSNNDVIYFDSFGVEQIPPEMRHFIGNKNIKTDICRIQANDSILYKYFSIRFIDFILVGKTLIDCSSFFHPMIPSHNFELF